MRRFFDIIVMAMLVITLAVGTMASFSGPSVTANACGTNCTLAWTPPVDTPPTSRLPPDPDGPGSPGIAPQSVGWNG
jgi:hypothetical protein